MSYPATQLVYALPAVAGAIGRRAAMAGRAGSKSPPDDRAVRLCYRLVYIF